MRKVSAIEIIFQVFPAILFMCLMFPILIQAQDIRGRWEELPSMPTPLHDLNFIACQGKIFAISGADDVTHDVVEIFDTGTNQWSSAAPIPQKRGWFACALRDEKIYCIGGKRIRTVEEKKLSGDESEYQYLSSVNIYDPKTNQWREGKSMHAPDGGVKAAVLDNKIFVLGGYHYPEYVEVYDPDRDEWGMAPRLPEGRMAPGFASVEGKLYVIGGRKGPEIPRNNPEKADVFIYDPQKAYWISASPMPTPRRDFATVITGTYIWCIGGVNQEYPKHYIDAVEVYDTRNDCWHTAPPIRGKAWMGACFLDGRVYIGGGARRSPGDKNYTWLDEMQALDIRPFLMEKKNEISVTWWGCMSFEVNIGNISFVFDPYMKPDAPRFEYIFCSHDHYDHCHEETLRKLIAPGGTRFTMLFAARSCFYSSRLESPNNMGNTLPPDLNFIPREKCIALYPRYRDIASSRVTNETRDAIFQGVKEVIVGRLKVEAFQSHEEPVPGSMYSKPSYGLKPAELSAPFPNLGYLVTDMVTGRSFAHTGDIWASYPEMERMRGKVDVLLYPLEKLSPDEKLKMMEYIQPQIAIPIHYRLLEDDFPIPADYLKIMKEEDVYKSREMNRAACLGHWYPSPKDPPSEIRKQREELAGYTRVVELKAGKRYILPEILNEFKGRVR